MGESLGELGQHTRKNSFPDGNQIPGLEVLDWRLSSPTSFCRLNTLIESLPGSQIELPYMSPHDRVLTTCRAACLDPHTQKQLPELDFFS